MSFFAGDAGPEVAILESAMPDQSKRMPRGPNSLARRVFLESIAAAPKAEAPAPKRPPASCSRRPGRSRGRVARAASLTSMRRSQIAAKAAAKRWGER